MNASEMCVGGLSFIFFCLVTGLRIVRLRVCCTQASQFDLCPSRKLASTLQLLNEFMQFEIFTLQCPLDELRQENMKFFLTIKGMFSAFEH